MTTLVLPNSELLAAPATGADGAAAEAAAAAACARVVEGSVDALTLGAVAGWARDPQAPDSPVEVEIVADGVLVGRVVAETLRGDLLAAAIGNGRYGFEFELPRRLFDGGEHTIDVRDVVSGVSLHGAPRTFTGLLARAFDARVEGAALVGWADLPGHDGAALELSVVEAGKLVTSGAAQSGTGERVQFRLPLPGAVFDGRAHAFTIVANDPPWLVAQLVSVMSQQLTPADALQRYAREGLKPALANVPALRYDALAGALDALSRRAPGAVPDQVLRQLVHCHSTLVRGASATDREFAPLRFERVESPKVSIVIPVHNKLHVTYHCLASLLLAPNRATFEVIVVDDGSSDRSVELPALVDGITCLRNETAQGFVLASNLGALAARGEYVVMLNNDTEVTAGWLDELLWPFEHFDAVGMTGAKLLYPDGRLQEAGGIVWSTGDPWNYGRHGNAADPRYNYTRQVDYLSGACVMLPTALWRELGGFDEAFVPAYFEDTDLAFRVRARGLKTVYAPKAQVVHYEGVSSGTDTASGIKRFQEVNRPKFKSRWVRHCRHNGKVGADVDLNKDRNVALRALVLDVETPQPDKNAGGYAAVQEMRLLQALGFKCTFVPLNMAWLGEYTERLQRMGVECVYAPFAAGVNGVVEARGAEFDLVYITRYNVAEQCIDAIRKHAPQAKVVLNNADLHFLRELRAGIAAANKDFIARAVQTRDKELAVMRRVDLVLSYTEVEQAVIVSHNLDSTRLARCPWVAEFDGAVPPWSERADIAFLGGFNHHPNAEAVQWFATRVLPLLRDALPEAKLRVYGSHVPPELHELADNDDRLVIEGWVPSVDVVYQHCRVFVAPLRSGAGIKGKVVDALARGVPSVLSPLAAEGIPLRDGIDARVATDPVEWVDALRALYTDAAAWAQMSHHAQALARREYGFDKGIREMQAALVRAEVFATTDHLALAAR